MPIDFLIPRVDRLRSDGGFETVHPGGVIGRLRRPVVLLARDLCTFALFETASLPASRRRQAARLHARAASPYVIGRALLVRAGNDFGIWWWDLERISPLVEARYGRLNPALRPETLAQPTGLGWRIVRLDRGQEAQLWRDKALVASSWRLDGFRDAAWQAFARLQRGPEPAPDQAPTPQALPVAYDGEAFSLASAEITREQALGMAAGGFAVASVSIALFLMGQGLHLSSAAAEVREEAVALRPPGSTAAGVSSMDADRQAMVAYRQLEETTSPMTAAGAAIGIAALYDLAPYAADADGENFSLTLPFSALRVADELITEFETSGYFYDVQPSTDAANDAVIFRMKVRDAAPPLTPEAG